MEPSLERQAWRILAEEVAQPNVDFDRARTGEYTNGGGNGRIQDHSRTGNPTRPVSVLTRRTNLNRPIRIQRDQIRACHHLEEQARAQERIVRLVLETLETDRRDNVGVVRVANAGQIRAEPDVEALLVRQVPSRVVAVVIQQIRNKLQTSAESMWQFSSDPGTAGSESGCDTHEDGAMNCEQERQASSIIEQGIEQTHECVVDGRRACLPFDRKTQEVRRDRIWAGPKNDHMEEGEEACSSESQHARANSVGAAGMPSHDCLAQQVPDDALSKAVAAEDVWVRASGHSHAYVERAGGAQKLSQGCQVTPDSAVAEFGAKVGVKTTGQGIGVGIGLVRKDPLYEEDENLRALLDVAGHDARSGDLRGGRGSRKVRRVRLDVLESGKVLGCGRDRRQLVDRRWFAGQDVACLVRGSGRRTDGTRARSTLGAERGASHDLSGFEDIEDTSRDAGALEIEDRKKRPVIAQAGHAKIVYMKAPEGTDEIAIARTWVVQAYEGESAQFAFERKTDASEARSQKGVERESGGREVVERRMYLQPRVTVHGADREEDEGALSRRLGLLGIVVPGKFIPSRAKQVDELPVQRTPYRPRSWKRDTPAQGPVNEQSCDQGELFRRPSEVSGGIGTGNPRSRMAGVGLTWDPASRTVDECPGRTDEAASVLTVRYYPGPEDVARYRHTREGRQQCRARMAPPLCQRLRDQTSRERYSRGRGPAWEASWRGEGNVRRDRRPSERYTYTMFASGAPQAQGVSKCQEEGSTSFQVAQHEDKRKTKRNRVTYCEEASTFPRLTWTSLERLGNGRERRGGDGMREPRVGASAAGFVWRNGNLRAKMCAEGAGSEVSHGAVVWVVLCLAWPQAVKRAKPGRQWAGPSRANGAGSDGLMAWLEVHLMYALKDRLRLIIDTLTKFLSLILSTPGSRPKPWLRPKPAGPGRMTRLTAWLEVPSGQSRLRPSQSRRKPGQAGPAQH
ncbi:hypothetical protein C8Q76DRAFT_697854 [Earliella scabrosa]|nr:hypothetical protein C8Q76DRAFT_697854 [Earliella scabrosa]